MPNDVYPSFRYRDLPAAMDFLQRAFGFEPHLSYDDGAGAIVHAELRHGDGLIMLGPGGDEADDDPRRPGLGWAYVAVADLDAHLERARHAGAEIVDVHDEDYGRFYAAKDPEGNLWSFGTYRPQAAAD